MACVIQITLQIHTIARVPTDIKDKDVNIVNKEPIEKCNKFSFNEFSNEKIKKPIAICSHALMVKCVYRILVLAHINA